VSNDLQKAEKQLAAAEGAVGSAQSVVADLEAKRTTAIQHGTELADERANVALAAHTGDEKAAQRLQEIHQAIAVHGRELASLDAAIRAAGDKVAAAQGVVDQLVPAFASPRVSYCASADQCQARGPSRCQSQAANMTSP
jgi:hypothetical protein